jgi:hypothetical protein
MELRGVHARDGDAVVIAELEYRWWSPPEAAPLS